VFQGNALGTSLSCLLQTRVCKRDSKRNDIMNPTTVPATNGSKNILNSDVEIKGTLKFTGELTFEGKLDGEVQTEGLLVVGDSAVITGNINAQAVSVRGKVNGNIIAKERIDLKAKAELFGDVRSAKLVIEEGVTFVGKTEVNPNKVAPTVPPGRTQEVARPLEALKPGTR
jgi:cytoskeletal protein CcmA (bactofilin family)